MRKYSLHNTFNRFEPPLFGYSVLGERPDVSPGACRVEATCSLAVYSVISRPERVRAVIQGLTPFVISELFGPTRLICSKTFELRDGVVWNPLYMNRF
jgi:hypothetical protein